MTPRLTHGATPAWPYVRERATGSFNEPASRATRGGRSLPFAGIEGTRRELGRPLRRLSVPVRPLGADSRFFTLLGSAPQELNTARPEAKLTC
jgi:hypothetical protein